MTTFDLLDFVDIHKKRSGIVDNRSFIDDAGALLNSKTRGQPPFRRGGSIGKRGSI